MPVTEKESQERGRDRPRVAGLFGGFPNQNFQDALYDILDDKASLTAPIKTHWRAKFTHGDYCSDLLDELAGELVEWLYEEDVPRAMVVADTPAALAVFRARVRLGHPDLDLVIGVSGNPALAAVFSEFRANPVNVEAPPHAFSVLNEEGAAAKKVEILLQALHHNVFKEADFDFRAGPLQSVGSLDHERGAGWENTIVIITNYSNPGWEREVQETYAAVYSHNTAPARTGVDGDGAFVRLLTRGVSCHYPTNPHGKERHPQNVNYNVHDVLREIETINGLKGLVIVGDAASEAYRAPIVQFGQALRLPSAWENPAVLNAGLPIGDRGTLCFAAPRGPMWKRAAEIVRGLVINGVAPAAPPPEDAATTSVLFLDGSVVRATPPADLAGVNVTVV